MRLLAIAPNLLAIATATTLVSFSTAQGPCLDAPVNYGAPIGYEVHFGDLNNDGLDDLATGESWGSNVHIRLCNPDGTFGSAATYPSCTNVGPYLFADLNNDGNQDLVVGQIHGSNTFGVHYGDGSGAIGPYVSIESGSPVGRVYPIDLNSDGLMDLVRTAPPSQAYLNLGTGFTPFNQGMWGALTGSLIDVADMNLDGMPDIIEGTGGQTVVHYCDASFTLITSEVMAPIELHHGRYPITRDFDLDGLPDLVGCNTGQLWLVTGGSGNYSAGQVVGPATVIGYAALDYDGDGDVDLATIHNSAGVAIIENNMGTLDTVHTFSTAVSWIQSVIIHDYDFDGVMDLALYGHTSGLEFRRNCTLQGRDCNGNGISDDQEIAADPSLDWNGDGVLDECSSPNYCTANPNTTGNGAVMSLSGTPVILDNDLTLIASQMPSFEWGYFLMANSKGFIPNVGGSSGNLCLGFPFYRYNKPRKGQVLSSGPGGTFSFGADLNNLPQGVMFQAGETWNFQGWYRDGAASTSNFTDGIAVMFR